MYQLKSFDSVLCFSRLISLLFPTSSLKNIIAMSILINRTSVYILLPIDVINVHTNYIFFRIEASPISITHNRNTEVRTDKDHEGERGVGES